MDKIDDRGLVLDGVFYETPQYQILQGACLKVISGAICSLFGRNGSGKSTLLKVAAGEITPASGLTIIDGERFYKKELCRRFEKISYLPQDSMLPPDMKANRLIRSFPTASHFLSNDPIIGELVGKRIDELSTGKRRYLEIRLLLSLEREYVLLDEPFTRVEPIMIEQIENLIIAAAKQGKGLLLTDHYYRNTIPIVNDAYLMMHKQCIHLDPAVDLREQLREYGYVGRKKEKEDVTER